MDATVTVEGDMFKLTTDNYSYWKPMMEDHLYCKDLHEPIITQEKPEGKDDKAWEILNRKAVAVIRKYIDRSLFEHVSTFTNAFELWTKLESMIQKKTPRNKALLVRRLVKMEYKDGQGMMEHLNNFKGLVNQLSKVDMKVEDEMQALLLLSSLPESWDTLVVTLSNSAPEGKLTMDTVSDSLLNEETRRKERGSCTQMEANVIVRRGRDEMRGRNKVRGRDQSRGRSKSRTRGTCYYCGRVGHRKVDCWFFKKDQQSGNVKPDRVNPIKKHEDKTTSIVAKEDEDVYLIGDCNMINIASSDTSWIVDSGASFHVTPHRSFFTTYQNGDFGNVQMGNQGRSKIVGKGDINLTSNTGCKLILKDVRHVPDIRLNLISTGKLDDAGLGSHFGDGMWKLTKGSLVMARGRKEGSLYVTQAKLCKEEVNVASDEMEIWHRRLGHMSEKALNILARKNLLPDMRGMTLEPCSDCFAGKQHRVAFQRSSTPTRRKHILDLVHTDVCSMSEKSMGGASYFVTFIDDHSRKVWVRLLKSKDQVLDAFKEFVAKVERSTGQKLKCVRSDNGGEYRGPFESFCNTHGIRMEKTPPKTPQLNGIAERMNRTIGERVRCMLSHAKLSKAFWGEALMAAVDIINLTPSIPLDGDVPEEVWSGKKVSYNHLKVFGCRAFVHIPRDERAKLDSKTKECIYLGSPKDEFGYRLWDPVTRKVVRSRDVVFFEDQTIEDIQRSEKPKLRVSRNVESLGSHEDSKVPVENGDVDHEEEVTNLDNNSDNIGEEGEMEPTEESTLRRSSRGRVPSTRYDPEEYVTITNEGEPQSYQEAIDDAQKEEWEKAMQEEMQSLHENHTYELVKLPNGRKTLCNKWVYRIKSDDGSLKPRYKARLVVKGFHQKKGIDFEEIFSPVVKMSSIRVVLGLAATLDLEIEQLDVKTAFLHGDLEEEIYMKQPEGFQVSGKENMVCRLKKSLYGLKQAPRQWYKKFDSFMEDHSFKKTMNDHCVFMKKYASGDFLILLLYVDDMLIVGHDINKIAALKKDLSKCFAMKDLGPAKQILGMKIIRDRSKKLLWISQEKYVEKVLERFNMNKAKPVSTPLGGHFKLSSEQCPTNEKEIEEMKTTPYASAVGSLMYAMVCTRPDIAYAVGVVSRFLANPGKEHWKAVKWILCYLRGTTKKCLCFGNGKLELKGYTDADWAGDKDARKSTSGYVTIFAGGAVSWQSKLQKCVALSTTEAEYIAATEACKEMLWMKNFLCELGVEQDKYIMLCDNQSAIHLAKNSTLHSRSKHIDIRHHWIREVLEEKLIYLEKVHTNENWSDMMTKKLPIKRFEDCCLGIGVMTTSGYVGKGENVGFNPSLAQHIKTKLEPTNIVNSLEGEVKMEASSETLDVQLMTSTTKDDYKLQGTIMKI